MVDTRPKAYEQARKRAEELRAQRDALQENRVLNVAAYCRVSTDDIEQTISIELQKRNYREMIHSNPKWKFAGLYVEYVEMLTPTLIQMHTPCTQTAS